MENKKLTKEEILERLAKLSYSDLVKLINEMRAKEVVYDENYTYELPDHVQTKLKEERYGAWVDLVNKLPRKLRKPPKVDRALINRCRTIWAQNCYGNEHICDILIDHVIEYSTTMKTKPILFVGSPGCGKSLTARLYASMMNLELVRIDTPLATHGRGLSGECGSYQDASCGLIVEGMINKNSLNYVLQIEEIDKATCTDGKNISFQDQALKLTDEGAKEFMDNYLQFAVDASHIPIIFTANDVKSISQPLRDRCSVIKFPDLTKEDVFNIVKNFAIPQKIKEMRCEERVEISEETIAYAVESVWKTGETSVRPNQQLVDTLIANAFRRSVEEEKERITITNEDVSRGLQLIDINNKGSKLGFKM